MTRQRRQQESSQSKSFLTKTVTQQAQAQEQTNFMRETVENSTHQKSQFQADLAAVPVQRESGKAQENTGNEQKPPNHTGLPDSLKAGLENLSGIDMGDVRVHYNSPKPFQLNALAYTQGTDIYVGLGQEHHLPHEGWHVVQQKQGRVKPTIQRDSIKFNEDAHLEQEAEAMGRIAIREQNYNIFPIFPTSINPRGKRHIIQKKDLAPFIHPQQKIDQKVTAKDSIAYDKLTKEHVMTGFGLETNGQRWYSQIKWKSVNDDTGDGQDVEANPLGPDHLLGSTTGGDNPKQVTDRTRFLSNYTGKEYVRGHLLNEQVGGSGKRAENLAAIPSLANKDHSNNIEKKIVDWVKEGAWLYYHLEIKFSYENLTDQDKVKIKEKLDEPNSKMPRHEAKKILRDGKIHYANMMIASWNTFDASGKATNHQSSTITIRPPKSVARGAVPIVQKPDEILTPDEVVSATLPSDFVRLSKRDIQKARGVNLKKKNAEDMFGDFKKNIQFPVQITNNNLVTGNQRLVEQKKLLSLPSYNRNVDFEFIKKWLIQWEKTFVTQFDKETRADKWKNLATRPMFKTRLKNAEKASKKVLTDFIEYLIRQLKTRKTVEITDVQVIRNQLDYMYKRLLRQINHITNGVKTINRFVPEVSIEETDIVKAVEQYKLQQAFVNIDSEIKAISYKTLIGTTPIRVDAPVLWQRNYGYKDPVKAKPETKKRHRESAEEALVTGPSTATKARKIIRESHWTDKKTEIDLEKLLKHTCAESLSYMLKHDNTLRGMENEKKTIQDNWMKHRRDFYVFLQKQKNPRHSATKIEYQKWIWSKMRKLYSDVLMAHRSKQNRGLAIK